MKIVLLSGGSGKRLWPMSNDVRSKQFLKVLQGPDGSQISMLQRVWNQLTTVNLLEDAYVCASKAQADSIHAQVGFVPVIEEPERRDTFAAIALSCTYLADVVGCSDDEVMVVAPVDHYVDNEYFERVSGLEEQLNASHADLALLGVEPTEPSSKFGYISVEGETTSQPYRQVQSFVEKPDEDQAKKLIASGALWNCGVFCFRIGWLKNILLSKGISPSYTDIRENFKDLPKNSFDYEVVEHASSVVASPYNGKWKDLGTWSSLTEEMGDGFVGLGETVNCEGTHVINELGIPLIGMGLKDTVVVSSPDGILVADKQQSSQLKAVLKKYHGRPMFDERMWGSYRVLDYQELEDGTEVLTKSIELKQGHNLSYQKHRWRSEVWTFVEGEGELAVDDRIIPITPGDVVRVYAEQWHAIRALTPLKFIEVQRGAELVEEDIVRKYVSWEDVQRHCGVTI
ncbi:sugar phosphate nucleotidyltransferase [Alicyclobacillus sp. SO9]|uniref:sugar phosphate nucleotidyltransferase n=1 Tax=Alicyclobacillus sp. SO9 TaxID=2665646 RepID=UPI0018E717D3|nr:sugar phosphate nucleotidyltransferase [Alicyclobacillus sp. SO9]QQE79327.1 cupin domain-containing protein [Alicyclobacillus sp. SO9]